jgi:hypothetical protein
MLAPLMRWCMRLHGINATRGQQDRISHPVQCGQRVTPGLPKSGPLTMRALQEGYGQYSRSSAGSPASAACHSCEFMGIRFARGTESQLKCRCLCKRTVQVDMVIVCPVWLEGRS